MCTENNSFKLSFIHSLFQFTDLELEGFIHTLSPIKKANNKSNSQYFGCLVQTRNASKVRAVSYETKKRTTLHQAYSSKSPGKISQWNDYLPQVSVTRWKSTRSPKWPKSPQPWQSLTVIQMWHPQSTVFNKLLKATYTKLLMWQQKNINKENNKQPIFSKGKQLMKTDCVIADHTNTIALTLWEDLIDAVDCGKTHKFKNVNIRSFNDIKYLTTDEGTIIHQDQDICDINMDCEDISLSFNISEGKCISAKLKRELSCIACNACIKGTASDGMITCQNCQMTTLEENCSHKLVAQLMILTAKGKVQSYTCFIDALQSFLASNNTNLTIGTTDLDELKKLLLESPAKQMILDDSTKTITQFLL